ncbi:GGDEF domain-containing protein [Kineosporia sp. A_224]|uniref:GGDEF domain-containing protein n=1 Tax=Kineosporia sp. A_224 TaxID=1962180 RepID=UPI000B4AB817|nr:GGDEF domain-containing protein [Kineosporia sp. A_224]
MNLSATTLRAAARPRAGGPPALLAAAVAVGAAVAVLAGLGPLRARVALVWVLLAAVHLALVVRSYQVVRTPTAGPATRRVWRGAAVSGLAFLAGDVVQLVVVATRPEVTLAVAVGVPVQGLLVLAGTGVVIVTFLLEPLRLGSRRAAVRFCLDLGIVLAVAATGGAYLMGVTVGSSRTDTLLAVLTGPGLFLVATFAVAKVALGQVRPFSLPAGLLLVAAAGAETVLQVIGPGLVARDLLSAVLLLHVVANGLLAAAATVQLVHVRTGAGDGRAGPRRLSLVPFLAVVISNALLVQALAVRGLDGPGWVAAVGAVCVTALVVARQVVVVVELDRALRDRDRLAGRLRHQAFHDPLTGLANRARFEEVLEAAIGTAGEDDRLVLLVLDLDGFKPVNDAYGHATGDRVLEVVARRLSACVREGDLVARIGGDEFALVVHGRAADADLVAQRVVDAVAEPVRLDGRADDRAAVSVQVGASVGGVVAAHPARLAGPGDLLHRADLAMYEAKRLGTGRYVLRDA